MRIRWNRLWLDASNGDTIAIALWRNGIRATGYSRRHHRALGASSAIMQGALVMVDGVPNVHADCVQVREGMEVRRQGAWPHASFDLLQLASWVPNHHLRGGFERPYWLRSGTRRFQWWEQFLMRVAGGGEPPRKGVPVPRGIRHDVDVVVIGGGPHGIRAANEAVQAGETACLVSRSLELESLARALGARVTVLDDRVISLPGHEAPGTYRRGTVVVAAPRDASAPARLIVAKRLVIATGRESAGPLIPGLDLPGVFDARTALRWARQLGSELGSVVVVGTGLEGRVAEALAALGVPIVATGDAASLEAILGRSGVTAARIAGRTVACRAIVHAGPWIASQALAFQAAAAGTLRLEKASLPDHVSIVGAALEANESLLYSSADSGRVRVCACMDVSADEIHDRIRAGETHIEELKRATSCGMGPCQGFPCWERLRAVVAEATGTHPDDIPSSRPPARTLTVAQAAGLDGLLELE